MGAARNKKLIQSIRERAFENRRGIYVPRVEGDIKRASWPVCMTCHQDVDSVNVEDVGNESVTIRARCHGEEAVVRLDFPYQILKRTEFETWNHVQNALNTVTFFNPSIAE